MKHRFNVIRTVLFLTLLVSSITAVSITPVGAQVTQVKTDKATYPPGDSITISGTAAKGAYVSIQVTNPTGTIVLLTNILPDESGAYQRQFKLPSNTVEGIYTIKASQEGIVKTATFQIAEQAPTVTTSRGHARITITGIAAGKAATANIAKTQDMAVRTIEISVKNSVNNIVIDITKLAGKPASVTVEVTGNVYHYISIDKTNLADADIDSATVDFGVEKSWITANNIDRSTVALQRYQTTGWSKLPTTEIDEDTDTVYYSATSPGLSTFAITGQTPKTSTTISIQASKTSINKGESITLSGTITPAVQGATVTLTYTKAGAVVVERSATTQANGSFSDTYTPDSGGSWSVTANWAGDEIHQSATSSAATFEVVDKKCLIATATYGSELAPEVQFLRGFREKTVYSTYAGSQFMSVFNAWYYSFSPYVASAVATSPPTQTILRGILYPLLGILHLATEAGNILSFNSEIGVVIAGLIASALIGAVYFAPAVALSLYSLNRRWRHLPKVSQLRWVLIPWLGSFLGILLGELSTSLPLMMVATSVLVVSTIALTAGTIALKTVNYFSK